ncbi:hypothetical protein EVAR_53493_1 [Eumeta japonica]|uniref:Uncharacterized protein n=1 Tax=Eumeta variegata TaxID=151549 RepID=A0A4C1YV31_EUMVA|nr:hypothetical protein EVAR_53493_1 [Eumeta japonica]
MMMMMMKKQSIFHFKGEYKSSDGCRKRTTLGLNKHGREARTGGVDERRHRVLCVDDVKRFYCTPHRRSVERHKTNKFCVTPFQQKCTVKAVTHYRLGKDERSGGRGAFSGTNENTFSASWKGDESDLEPKAAAGRPEGPGGTR